MRLGEHRGDRGAGHHSLGTGSFGNRWLRLQAAFEVFQHLQQFAFAHQPGDVVALLVERDGQRFNLDVTLEARPQSGP